MIHRTATEPDWGDGAWEANTAAIATIFTSADAKEGPTAFARSGNRSGRAADP